MFAWLRRNGIEPGAAVALEDNSSYEDKIVVEELGGKWEVYAFERGRKIAPRTFEEEAEAYEHVRHVIQGAMDYYKQKTRILQYGRRK
jgi:hypothetical protein